jgi:UDP-N-acetylglucosamine 4,6-dehydratase
MTRFWITLPRGVEVVLSCLDGMRGGEIVVPKVPSMRVADMAAALAPGRATHTVGIRPGEKLHEVLITEDDARLTWDLGDRYVIEPAFATFERAGPPSDARPVPEGFRYASDTNTDWLGADAFRRLLAETDGAT